MNKYMIIGETWKSIEGYEGLYEISDLGNVKSLNRIIYFGNKKRELKEKILKYIVDSDGYLTVHLSKNAKSKKNKIHRLVAQAFILNPKNKSEVNHKDGNKQNNNISNLEWCTSKENNLHAIENKLLTVKFSGNGNSKLTNSQVRRIKFISENFIIEKGYWAKLSRSLKIGHGAISDIILNKSWQGII